MKFCRILIAGLVAMAAMEGSARFYTNKTGMYKNAKRCGNGSCNNVAASGKKLCASCQRVADEAAKKRAKEMMARLKNVTVSKVSVEEGDRIPSLCGYELGTIFKKGPAFEVDESGDIIVSGRLKKPFRKCNWVALRYSKHSGALYSIRIYSNPLENMDEAKAKSERDAIMEALRTKFNDKISGWHKSLSIKNEITIASSVAFDRQSLTVDMSEQEIGFSGLVAPGKKGWVFSVTLVDNKVKEINLFDKSADSAEQRGVDAADLEAL